MERPFEGILASRKRGVAYERMLNEVKECPI